MSEAGGAVGSGFTQSQSATSGLTGYDLEGQRGAASKKRKKRQRKREVVNELGRVIPALFNSNRKVMKMSKDRFGTMFDALTKSVASIVDAPKSNQKALLAKTTSQFRAAFEDEIGAVMEKSFNEGLTGNFRKFSGANMELNKSLGGVAEFATLLRAAETSANQMEADRLRENMGANSGSMQALREWVKLGKQVLSMMVSESNGDMPMTDKPPVDEVTAAASSGAPVEGMDAEADAVDPMAEDTTPVEAVDEEEFGKLAKRLRKAMRTYGHLRKADGEEADPDAAAEDLNDLDPLDVVGRLAAAIVMQIDALKNPEGAEGEDMAEGDEAEKMDDEGVGADDEEDEDEDEDDKDLEKEADKDDEDDEEEEEEKPFAKSYRGTPKRKSNGSSDRALVKMSREMTELKNQLKKLQDGPAPAKGSRLIVTDKSGDDALGKGANKELEALAKRLDAMTPEQRSVEMMKVAMGNPRRI